MLVKLDESILKGHEYLSNRYPEHTCNKECFEIEKEIYIPSFDTLRQKFKHLNNMPVEEKILFDRYRLHPHTMENESFQDLFLVFTNVASVPGVPMESWKHFLKSYHKMSKKEKHQFHKVWKTFRDPEIKQKLQNILNQNQ